MEEGENMIEIPGKYNTATIYTDNVEKEAISQIYDICNHPIFKDQSIKIMPDVHAGKGCVVGFTSTMPQGRIIPSLIGVDIGCGMLTVSLGQVDLKLSQIDMFIREFIPHGNSVNAKINPAINAKASNTIKEICERIGDTKTYERHLKSIGSLGGGNHFIEISEDSKQNKYLIIHSGSRNFGHKIATYYQDRAFKDCDAVRKALNIQLNKYKGENKITEDEHTQKIEKLKEVYAVPKDLSFLDGATAQQYIHDMQVAQQFAAINRMEIASRIVKFISGGDTNFQLGTFETIHNYISPEGFIRKGAVSAFENELLLIPINMRDGSILARGKGNKDWNYSAPHGAGRLMSRSKAKTSLDFEEYRVSMRRVYSTSVNRNTLDEAPMAYKNMEEIIENTKDTIEVVDILKPVYNFKSN
jgi:RNA-splicing ligase RtcB